MARSMWRGAISFGMVAIPVRMYLATESKGISFRLLCPTCHNPIKNRRWCPVEEKEVGWSETLRGYEVTKNEFVVIDDSDLDNLPLPTAQTIEILEFVADDEIEAGVYLKGAYYLEPEAVGVKPYYLLKSALTDTKKVAIGKVALRDREHLCRLALHEHGLLLNTLHWPDEIRSAAELSLPEDKVTIHDRELEMAKMLIGNLTASFNPERYHDEFREALVSVVEAKLGQQPLPRIEAAEPAPVMDLMAALKASVDASKEKAGAGATRDGEARAARTVRARAGAGDGAEAAESRPAAPRRRKAS